MYQLVSAIAKPIDGETRWQDLDLSALTFIQIYSLYSKVFAVLTNSFLDAPVSLDFADIRDKVGTLDVTFSDWLVTNGNLTLPTSDTIPKIDTTFVRYADAFHAGYTVAPIHDLFAPDTELPPGAKTSLYLTKSGLDVDLFVKNCLVSVNGFFHVTDKAYKGIRVMKGDVSRQKSLEAQVGVHSFREVGELELIPITKEMLYKQSPDGLYSQQTYIDIGKDIGDRTMLLVLGGYLHVLDNTYYRVGDHQYCIDFQNYPMAKRFYESEPFLDFSSLPYEKNERNKFELSVADLKSDAFIEAYATLPQSFFVVVDTNDLYVELSKLENAQLPGMYVSHVPPIWPLRVGFGKISEYWYVYEDTQWSVHIQESLIPNYNFQTVDAMAQRNIDNSRYPYRPDEISPAFFMKICKDV
jgi:hypothetical protein